MCLLELLTTTDVRPCVLEWTSAYVRFFVAHQSCMPVGLNIFIFSGQITGE